MHTNSIGQATQHSPELYGFWERLKLSQVKANEVRAGRSTFAAICNMSNGLVLKTAEDDYLERACCGQSDRQAQQLRVRRRRNKNGPRRAELRGGSAGGAGCSLREGSLALGSISNIHYHHGAKFGDRNHISQRGECFSFLKLDVAQPHFFGCSRNVDLYHLVDHGPDNIVH
jgi:hypothetical protein